jgi:phosphonate transport system substrate-binding protein
MFRAIRPGISLAVLATITALIIAACGTTAPAAPAATTAPAAPAATTAPAAPAATTAPAAPATGAVDRTGWPETFRVGIFGGDDQEKAINSSKPLAAHLEERLGIKVELTTGTSYSAVIEAMRAGRVEAMEVGPFSYVLAVQEAQAEAIAIATFPADRKNPVYSETAPDGYYSVLFTKKGSGISTVQDLKGVEFAFVDPASTSGHLVPKTALLKAGINPDTEMKTVFAGSHPTAVLSVWNDNTKAGATFEENLYRLADEGQIKFCGFDDGRTSQPRTPEQIKALYDGCPEGNIVIVGYSDLIPNTPFAMKQSLPESLKTEVRKALLEMKDNPDLVKAYGYWYTDPTERLGLARLDENFNSLRDIAKLLNLDLSQMK